MTTSAQVRLLVGAEVRSIRGRLRGRRGGEASAVVAGILYGLVVIYLAYDLYQTGALGPAYADGTLGRFLAASGGLLLVIAAGPVITEFFTSRSLLLISTMPVRPAALYISRALVVAFGGGVVGAGLAAALAGYGLGAHAPAAYWLGVVVTVPLVCTAAVAFHLVAFCAAVRIAPAHRVRDVAVVLSSLAVAVVYVGQFALSRSAAGTASHQTEVVPLSKGSFSTLPSGGTTCIGIVSLPGGTLGCERIADVRRDPPLATTSFPAAVPLAWPGKALAALADSDAAAAVGWSAAAGASLLAVMVAGFVLYSRTVADGIAALLEARRARGRRRRRRSMVAGPLVLALARKDLRLLRRDIRRLGAAGPALVMGLVYPFLFSRATGGTGWALWGQLLPLLYAPFLIGSVVSPLLINGEGRATNLLRLAPVRTSAILTAKELAAVPVTLFAAEAVGVVFCTVHHVGAGPSTLALFGIGWLALSMSSATLSVAAMSPHFEKQSRSLTAAGCLGSAIVLVGVAPPSVLGLAGLVGALPRLSGVGSGGEGAPTISVVGAVVGLGATIAVVITLRAVAVRRMAAWQPVPD